MRDKNLIIALVFAFNAMPVFAGSPGEKMTEINADIAVLEAQVKRDDLKLRQQKQKADMEKFTGGASTSELQVVWIEGVGTQKYAQLISENGNRMEVRQGDKLPNGAKVVQIAPNEVVIEDASKRKRMLSFAPASASATAGVSAVTPGMPSAMPVMQPPPMPPNPAVPPMSLPR